MIAYKLLNKRADGSLGPLFINRRQRIPLGIWLDAEDHKTFGYAHRPGWHSTRSVVAPHLSKKGRVWCRIEIEDYQEIKRPLTQGGLWYLSNKMRVIEEVLDE